MSTFTENYQLHQWVPEDNFLRADFNEDNAIIDAAIAEAAKPSYVIGSYTGDNTDGRLIEVGFTPSAVISFSKNGHTASGNYVYGGMALPGLPLVTSNATAMAISDGGFTVYYVNSASSYSYTNLSGCTYYYIAFR